MLVLATVFALTVQAATPIVDTDKGTWLFQACKGAIRSMDAASANQPNAEGENFYKCASYIGGFLDAESLFTTCFAPDNATLGTFIRVYVQYMTTHPKLLDDHRAFGLQAAYLDTYPCPTKK